MRAKLLLLTLLLSCLTASAKINFKNTQGWLESAFAEWYLLDQADTYKVYCKEIGGEYQLLDKALVRNYGTYGRADALGLKAGKYQFKVVPLDKNEAEITAMISETAPVEVKAHDRGGFAHHNYSGIGGYNDDGTLKSNAKVFYVSATNAKGIKGKVIIDSKGGVNEFTGMQAIINAKQKGYDTTPFVFRILGTIDITNMDKLESSEEGLQIKGKNAHSEMNITIEGVGNDANIRNFGFLIRQSKSVELRNFGIMLAIDDCISFDTDNSHCWVHNIDFFYGQTGSANDQAKGDGSLDCKANSQFMTFSYNHFWDSGKMALCGMKSESGENFITYHHNWFDHSDSRHPRVRTMTVHVYNNYFDGIAKYGVGATTGANVFVENNYYRNTNKPMLISKQGTDIASDPSGTFSGENGGMIKAFGNVYAEKSSNFKLVTHKDSKTGFDCYEADTRNEEVPASYVTLLGGTSYNNFDTDVTKMYSYTPHDATDVPTVVTGQYGAGRMQKGDFQWTFNNAVDDKLDIVNEDLKSAITNYQSELVGFFDEDALEGSITEDGNDDGNNGDGTNKPSGYDCFFIHPNDWSNKFYTIIGSTSNSKGTVTVNGTEYKICLKMESKTNITFSIDKPMTLTLVFVESMPNAKINGDKVTGSNGKISYDLAAGSHEITKADTNNLFFMSLSSEGDSTGIDSTYEDEVEDKNAPIYDLSGRVVNKPQPGVLYIQNGKKVYFNK